LEERDVGQAAGSEMHRGLVGNRKEIDHLEDLGVEEVNIRTDLKRTGLDGVGATCERCGRGNEHSRSIKCGEFVAWLRDCHLSKDCVILASLRIG
jgi:hypothetical protein